MKSRYITAATSLLIATATTSSLYLIRTHGPNDSYDDPVLIVPPSWTTILLVATVLIGIGLFQFRLGKNLWIYPLLLLLHAAIMAFITYAIYAFLYGPTHVRV